jgi:hypothetical protein
MEEREGKRDEGTARSGQQFGKWFERVGLNIS